MTTLPSCLTMVNRVLVECGDLEVASLLPGTPNSKIALEAMNDAQSDIWKRQRWPWQRQVFNLALVAGQADYPLPPRFDRMAEPLRLGAAGAFRYLREYTNEEWVQLNLGVPTTTGSPLGYVLSSTTLTMSPAPSTEFVSNFPTMLFSYFQSMPDRRTTSDGSNSWDVPGEFYDSLILFGKSRLKQYLGAQDFGVDMGAYEQTLKIEQNKYRASRGPAKVRPTNWVVSQW